MHVRATRGRLSPAILTLLAAFTLTACRSNGDASEPDDSAAPQADAIVPEWSRGVVWYQLFPERFRNGDPSNDPTRASLEFPEIIPTSWRLTPWTADWYRRDAWEQEMGPDFYEDGVFHRRLGGDLQGVLDKLDYLQELGIGAIYFNPVFHARSLHKYDASSFHHVDPFFGPDPAGDLAKIALETADPVTWQWTAADSLFLEVVREAHARGIRVVIDGVFNHTGRDFFAFADLREKGSESMYTDWYIVEAFDDPATAENEFAYKSWWGVETLPEFADNVDGTDLHPGPKAYVFAATRRWMDPDADGDPSDGVDGWRLDVAEEVPIGFWRDWNALVRQVNPDAYTVTEIWHDASEFLRDGGFSATMNYYGFAWPTKGFLIDDILAPSEFGILLNERRTAYREPVQDALMNLIDSHDTDRVASMIVNRRDTYREPERFDYDGWGLVSPRGNEDYKVRAPNEDDRAIQRLVTLFQMTYVGSPMIYYGTEAGMWGADDPDDRKPMVWPDLDYEVERTDPLGRERTADPVAFDQDLYAYFRSLTALRARHPVLVSGMYHQMHAGDEARTFAYMRADVSDTLVVAFNRSLGDQTVQLPLRPASATVVATTGPSTSDIGVNLSDGLIVQLPRLSGVVLAPSSAK